MNTIVISIIDDHFCCWMKIQDALELKYTHSRKRNLSPSLATQLPRLLIVDPCISIVWGTPDWNHEPSHCCGNTQFEDARKIEDKKGGKKYQCIFFDLDQP